VLDFSKLEAGQVDIKARPVSPGDVLRDALLMFTPQAEAKGLTLSFESDVSLPPALLIDPDRVRQILLNLIGNAVKFTEQGAIRVSASYLRKTQRLKVQVEDTGAGMTKAQLQKLFQRFSQVDASSTRRHGGTGLGLAICRGLAEAMGGDVGVRSRPGRGAVFHFQIEAPVAEAPVIDAERADLAGLLADLRVLVVDDNPVNRELARIVLESLGAEVTEAEDGLSALELASLLPVDVILLDIRMPGLGGREALAAIRTRDGPNQDVPILAFTADTDIEISPGGFDGLVRKPIVPADLAEAIHRATLWEEPEALMEAADAAAL
jgi:CheY-like chemotaxis protein/anti-sigma regulatory factor (Ser/Thr protein kinase)